MNMKEFFDFSNKLLPSTIQAHIVDLNINRLHLIKGVYQKMESPIFFKQQYGYKLCDILDTGYPGLIIISERMKRILEENHLTGWKVFPIKLYDKKDNEILGYYGFSITGHCGPTSYAKSEIIEKRLVPNGPLCKYYKGVTINDWDGSDFFTPEGTYETFITKKAADILTKNKISNMYLENLAEAEIDVDDVHL